VSITQADQVIIRFCGHHSCQGRPVGVNVRNNQDFHSFTSLVRHPYATRLPRRIGIPNGILAPPLPKRNPETVLWASHRQRAGSGCLPKRRAARRGAARRNLDMPLRIGYGSASGVSGRQGLGTIGLKTLRGPPESQTCWSRHRHGIIDVCQRETVV
jgi:hypothetical protein